MIITAEISYYPLTGNFEEPINELISKLSEESITRDTGPMSTFISGEYSEIMRILTRSMGDLMERYPSVFNLKISNTCPVE